jgi:hypothetical protein
MTTTAMVADMATTIVAALHVAREIGYRDGLQVAREDNWHGKPYNPYPRGKYAWADRGYRTSLAIATPIVNVMRTRIATDTWLRFAEIGAFDRLFWLGTLTGLVMPSSSFT